VSNTRCLVCHLSEKSFLVSRTLSTHARLRSNHPASARSPLPHSANLAVSSHPARKCTPVASLAVSRKSPPACSGSSLSVGRLCGFEHSDNVMFDAHVSTLDNWDKHVTFRLGPLDHSFLGLTRLHCSTALFSQT